jgi:hypothetical protein
MTRSTYDAILSYNSRDRTAVEQIGAWLEREGKLHVLLDKGDFNPGEPIHEELERALRMTRCLVIFLGPESLHRWQTEEAHDLLELMLRDHELCLIPVLLPGITPEVAGDIPLFFQRRRSVSFDRGMREVPVLKALAQSIRMAGDLSGIQADPPAAEAGGCPFRGLEPFDERHSELLFGRETFVQELLLRLQASRFLAVLGPPYCGKSSVIGAALLPELRAQGWACERFRPAKDPLLELARALYRLQSENIRWTVSELLEHLRVAGPPILGVLAEQILDDRHQENLILCIDPLDDVFDEEVERSDRARFFKLLTATAAAYETRVRIMPVMRSQWLGHCARDSDLNTLITRHLVQVGPPTEWEVRRMVLGPALLKGLALEDGLLELVLHDLTFEPGELPLLEHALTELFRRRVCREGRDTLTCAAYREMGGLVGSIGGHAEAELAKSEQRFGKRATESLRRLVLLHLVEPQPGRGRVRVAERSEALRVEADPAWMEEVLGEWIDARLLAAVQPPAARRDPGMVAASEPPADAQGIQLAHEGLMEWWPRLRDWIAHHHADARAIDLLRKEAASWFESQRAPDRVLSGARLMDAEDLAARYVGGIPSELREFLDASLEARDASGRWRREALQRELQQARDLAQARERALQSADARAAEAERLRTEAEARSREHTEALRRVQSRSSRLKWLAFSAVTAALACAGLAGWLAYQFGWPGG